MNPQKLHRPHQPSTRRPVAPCLLAALPAPYLQSRHILYTFIQWESHTADHKQISPALPAPRSHPALPGPKLGPSPAICAAILRCPSPKLSRSLSTLTSSYSSTDRTTIRTETGPGSGSGR